MPLFHFPLALARQTLHTHQMVPEPKPQVLPHSQRLAQRSLEGRWRSWYAAIADLRITKPGITNVDIAQILGKHEQTVGAIIRTDMYREYEAQRRAHWLENTENIIRNKLVSVTSMALDGLAARLERQKDQVPLEAGKDIAAMGLEALGFGPKPVAPVSVNVNQNNVQIPNAVSPAALEEARATLRQVESAKLKSDSILELKAGPPPEAGLDSPTSESRESEE